MPTTSGRVKRLNDVRVVSDDGAMRVMFRYLGRFAKIESDVRESKWIQDFHKKQQKIK
jgi:hypothetical protein